MIELMPESAGNIVGIRATGTLTGADYEKVLIPRLEELFGEYGRLRILLNMDEVVAQPYIRPPWTALRKWTDQTKQPFNAILLQNKSSAKNPSDKAANLDDRPLKEGNPEAAGWSAYDSTRQAWKRGKFKKEFPDEATYRHSLKEETEALDAMVAVLAPEAASLKKAEKLDPSLLALIQVDHEGLLEPFVLLNRADPEIAKDYPAYRSAHRDQLYRYVDEFVLPKTADSAAK